MNDIENRKDIELLVDSFYEQVIVDEVIGTFFTQVVLLDMEKHMPIMHDFWDSTLLGAQNYHGNPMVKHIQLSQKKQLEKVHFERWLLLWKSTIDRLFKGAKADEAKQRAENIATLMLYKTQADAS